MDGGGGAVRWCGWPARLPGIIRDCLSRTAPRCCCCCQGAATRRKKKKRASDSSSVVRRSLLARGSERVPRVHVRVHKHVQLEAVDGRVEGHGGGAGAVCGDVVLRGVAVLVVDLGGLEGDVFGVEGGVRLAEHVVPVLGVVEQLLEVLYPLVLALAVGSLRSAVLGSPALWGWVVNLRGFWESAAGDATYRQDGWRGVLVAVLALSLGCWFLRISRVGRFAVLVPRTWVSASAVSRRMVVILKLAVRTSGFASY